ncbi:MAG: hypothetical protein U1F44_06495 [Coriobacteriia bacterium]|nr:hypothetical protein [Coriobacteriia bacterium]
MSDENPTPEAAEADIQPQPADTPAEKKPFLPTGGSKTMLAVVALGALAIIAGVVVALVLFVFTVGVDDTDITVTSDQPAATSETTAATEDAEPAEAVTNAEVFTFRDIFEPLLVAIVVPTTTSTTEADTANTTTTGTLYLTSILVQDGEYMAVLSLDGVSYTLGDGQQVGDSPWQVVTVRTDSVVMLYGDTQVILNVGQGVTK